MQTTTSIEPNILVEKGFRFVRVSLDEGSLRLLPRSQRGEHYVRMEGNQTYRFATKTMATTALESIRKSGLQPSDVDLFIPHQANVRIIEATAKHANIPMDKVYVNVDRFGNTSSASIPIALAEAIECGRIKEGSTVLMVAFGAGFTWGSSVIRF